MYDVIIIGGGPAGVAAAIYDVRAGLQTLLIEKSMIGGQATLTHKIDNYPGISSVPGYEFAMKLQQHLKEQHVEIKQESVESLELTSDVKRVITNKGVYETKTVIMANGLRRRELGCPGEIEFKGKGVSYCATCDGAFFRGKDVCLVGGGNTALADALFLSNHCNRVTVIHRRNEFRASRANIAAIQERENITCLMNARLEEIQGEDIVQSVRVRIEGEVSRTQVIRVDGVFIAVGYEAENVPANNAITANSSGYYYADENMRTNIAGVFVAGDCRDKEVRQIITAEADGAIAAISAANYVNASE